jgi:hypothetical protein
MGKKKKASHEGYCSICKKFSKLTEDHVPPKGCINVGPVEVRMLYEHLRRIGLSEPMKGFESLLKERKRGQISQNGLKFNTICGHCNNTLLGRHYDRELIKLSQEVSLFVRAKYESGLTFPLRTSIPIKTNQVARAVVGHILAGVREQDVRKLPYAHPPWESMRAFFLDPTMPLPSDLEIHYWVYPANVQVIIRHLVLSRLFRLDGAKEYFIGDLLKFFPLAYWVVSKSESLSSVRQPKLIKNRNTKIDDVEHLEIPFEGTPSVNWPETPNEMFDVLSMPELTFIAETKG